MTNKSQEEKIELILLDKGFITRNEALSMYISRLSAIIWTLRHDRKYEIASFWTRNITGKGLDYIYVLKGIKGFDECNNYKKVCKEYNLDTKIAKFY